MLGVGIVLSLALFSLIRGWELREFDKRTGDLAREQVEKLEVSVLQSTEVLQGIASLYATRGGLEREPFRRFVQPALARQHELQALSWNPLVRADQRGAVEAAAVQAGMTGFSIREHAGAETTIPATARAEYVPVYFIEPMGSNEAALGYDLASDAKRRVSLERARDTGQPTATAPVRLAQGPENRPGFLMLLPVYRGAGIPATEAERRRELAGFAVAVFRVADLVKDVFTQLEKRGIDARLFDESPEGELLYGSTAAPARAERTIPLEIGGHHWIVAYAAGTALSGAQVARQSWLVLIGGLIFTALTTANLYGGWRRTREIAAANAALQDEVAVRMRAEETAAAANQAKSDFLASMSHEIRTPLNAILGYAQLMQRDPRLPQEQRDATRGILASGDHLLGLINEILDLSKIEAGRMELNEIDFDLAALVAGLATTFRLLCAQKGIAFRLELGQPGPVPVRGDEGKLRQVLINLAGNAVKFTSAGEVYVHFRAAANDHWLFEVIDTGLGIPEHEQRDIFRPFHQGSGARHQGGTGLGLSIAQRQVELLGGTLELQSERGAGSRFFFTIPLAPAAGEIRDPAPHFLRLAAGHRLRALVVDDNHANREVLGGMLSAVGCEVEFAGDGPAAIERVQASAFDAVFMDLLLPGMGGAETARRLRALPNGARPKVIAHTASAVARRREEAAAAGCVDFIAKPFRSERLYECLEAHCGAVFEKSELHLDAAPPGPAAKVNLPEQLCARLAVAAELHSTTALKGCLAELRERGPDAGRLADLIRELMRSYDMDAIQRLIASTAVPVPDEPALPAHGFAQA